MGTKTTKTNLTPKEAFEHELAQAFATPLQDGGTFSRDSLVPALHAMRLADLSDIAFDNSFWKKESHEGSITTAEGAQIDYFRIQRHNQTLVMTTDGERAYISTDSSKGIVDWGYDNIITGVSYRIGALWDKLTKSHRDGVDALPSHSGYHHVLMDGGNKSLEVQSMAKLDEWLEKHPNLHVEIAGFSRAGLGELLADEILEKLNKHNDGTTYNATLARVTTLNSPSIGKPEWSSAMNALYAENQASPTNAVHIRNISDIVSNIKLNGKKTGTEYVLFDGMLIKNPNKQLVAKLQDFNEVIGTNSIIAQHTKADEEIIAEVSNCSILTPVQMEIFEKEVTALHQKESKWITRYDRSGRYSVTDFNASKTFKEEYGALRDEVVMHHNPLSNICPVDIKPESDIRKSRKPVTPEEPITPTPITPQTPNADAGRIYN